MLLRDAVRGRIPAAPGQSDAAELPLVGGGLPQIQFQRLDGEILHHPAPLPDAAGHIQNQHGTVEYQLRGACVRCGAFIRFAACVRFAATARFRAVAPAVVIRRGGLHQQVQAADGDPRIEADEIPLKGVDGHRHPGEIQYPLFNEAGIAGHGRHEQTPDAHISRQHHDDNHCQQHQLPAQPHEKFLIFHTLNHEPEDDGH